MNPRDRELGGAPSVDPDTWDARAKSPTEIEGEIAQTRASLTATLDALEQKLAPRQLIEKGFDMVRDTINGDASTRRVGELLRENPIPLALIGAGIGWMLLSNTGGGRYTRAIREGVSDAAGNVGGYAGNLAGRVRGWVGAGDEGYAHARTKTEAGAATATAADAYGDHDAAARASARHGVSEYVSGASEYVSGAAGRVTEYGRQAWETAGDYAGSVGRPITQVRDRFGQVMEDYPLAVGALGFLAGAVIAASLPSTRIEDEWVGEHRDDLLRQAKDTGEDVWNRAQDLAKNAAGAAAEAARDALSQTAEAVREEAEKQGFTPDAIKEQAQHALGSATAGSKPVAASDNGSKSANASGTVPHGGSKPSAADRSSLSAVSSLSSATSSGKGENPPENR